MVGVVEDMLQEVGVIEGMLQVVGKDEDILLEIIEVQVVGVVEEGRLLSADEVVYLYRLQVVVMFELDMEDFMELETGVVGNGMEMVEVGKGLMEVFEGSLWGDLGEGGRWIGKKLEF